jgi:hypothetical protein
MADHSQPLLTIAFYEGEYSDDLTELALLCDMEDSSTPYDRPSFTVLGEIRCLLGLCTDRYTVHRHLQGRL